MDYKKFIATIEGFPKEGISFKDCTPLLENGEAYHHACHEMAEIIKGFNANIVVGPESRGFLFGCPIAYELNIGFVPIRKPGKLPREVVTEAYELEYSTNTLCMHADAIRPGDKVVIVDDLLATGGTVLAAKHLVEKLGGEVVGIVFLIELEELNGRKLFEGVPVHSLIKL